MSQLEEFCESLQGLSLIHEGEIVVPPDAVRVPATEAAMIRAAAEMLEYAYKVTNGDREKGDDGLCTELNDLAAKAMKQGPRSTSQGGGGT